MHGHHCSPGSVECSFTEQVPQRYRFAGGYQNPTGPHHLKPPRIGRSTSPDPSGQEKNPYLYAEGDPVNRIDPSGTLSLKSFAGKAMKKLGTASDILAVGEFGAQMAEGQYKEAAGTALSFAADKAFTAGCTALTSGAGAVPCAVGGMAVGELTNAAYEKATS